MRVAIFEKTGEFGGGAIHSALQGPTSFLNRVASQLSFAADETVSDATALLPQVMRPDMLEWCRQRHEATNDRRYALTAADVPSRSLYGEALGDMFQRYVLLLRTSGVAVDLYTTTVTKLERSLTGRFDVYAAGDEMPFLSADFVLLVTGHAENPSLGPLAGQRHFVVQPYPLTERLSTSAIPPDKRVGITGQGLTAIDIILHLTEGRGGRFDEEESEFALPNLRYRPSGAEPAAIVVAGTSGLFTFTRARNQKVLAGAPRLGAKTEGRFLNSEAIDTLRSSVGTVAELSTGSKLQIDFGRDVFPLVVLEMAIIYYGTLLGSEYRDAIAALADRRVSMFTRGQGPDADSTIDWLLEPIDRSFEAAAGRFERQQHRSGAIDGDEMVSLSATSSVSLGPMRQAFAAVVDLTPSGQSRWGHSPSLEQHRFRWREFFDPVPMEDAAETNKGNAWQSRVVEFFRRDVLAAAQGNVSNPTKAACDGVWRDLRSVYAGILDRGGLTAESQKQYRDVYHRYYTRMSNGADVGPMRKLLALMETGLVDVSIGPSPGVVSSASDGSTAFTMQGLATGAVQSVDCVIEGRLHEFDPTKDIGLYAHLLEQGLIRRWENPGRTAATNFCPGALDLDDHFHPFDAEGRIDQRLTVIGAPAEGLVNFQHSAARPNCSSPVLADVAAWAEELLTSLRQSK